MTWNDYHTEIRETSDLDVIKSFFPPILYKYRTWDNPKFPFDKTVLTKQELFFSSAYGFDDPDDCRFPVDFDFSFERAEAFFKRDLRVNRNLTWTDEQIKAFAKYKHNEGFGSPAKLEQKRKDFYEFFNNAIGILCLCHQSNVVSMWSGYADNFNGFCVGMSLGDYAQDLHQNLIFGGQVNYVATDFPPLKQVWAYEDKTNEQAQFFLRLVMTKYENFRHEDEYRFGKLFPDGLIPTQQERTFVLPKPAFKEVIFGCQLSSLQREEIIDACQQQQLDVEYKVASPTQDGSVVIKSYQA